MPKITETFATRAARIAAADEPTPEQRHELVVVTRALAAQERIAEIDAATASLAEERARLAEDVAAATPKRVRR